MATLKFPAQQDDSEPRPTTRMPTPSGTSVERYRDGWRSGKPVEDPEKLKRWGYVGAKPSEYLVVTRNGHIDRKRSGQGARIFKWPSDSVAIVPTTLQRVEFVADQITKERVGVEIAGIAVFRIAEPELAFRVLNFSFGEAASEKLAVTLREMFVGAARRLVANLALDEVLTRRKETIASFLMEEISPVVSGDGSPDDTTSRGWGVVIDTIEIQQVTIQSAQVFAHLQAPFRAEIAARAELAELERGRTVTERRAETEQVTRALIARTESEAAEAEARESARRTELIAATARRNAELERDRVLHQIAIAEEQRRASANAEVAGIEAERVRVEAMHRAALLDQEQARAIAWQKQSAELELRRTLQETEIEARRREAEIRDAENAFEAVHQRRLAELEQLLSQSRTMRELVAALPQLARALQQNVQTMSITHVGAPSSDGPLNAVPAAFAQLLALAKSFGLELPRRDE